MISFLHTRVLTCGKALQKIALSAITQSSVETSAQLDQEKRFLSWNESHWDRPLESLWRYGHQWFEGRMLPLTKEHCRRKKQMPPVCKN